MILVIAGNYTEFEDFRREHPKESLKYVSRVEDCLGYRADRVVEIGTYYLRKDSGELYEAAKSRIVRRHDHD